jgi:hypothetical protein
MLSRQADGNEQSLLRSIPNGIAHFACRQKGGLLYTLLPSACEPSDDKR